MTHFIDISEVSRAFIETVFDRTDAVKDEPDRFSDALAGRSLQMLFAKPSTRTRTSFEAGMTQLGGHGIYFYTERSQMARGEALKDTAKVLSRYVDGIMARLYDHADIQELAEYADVPVINGLTDHLHPCQAVADLYTVQEHGLAFDEANLVYVGDGNNVAHSLLNICSLLGVDITVACPEGYEPDEDVVAAAEDTAAASGGTVAITDNLDEAVAGADVVYTDVWVSMGDEDEDERKTAFAPFQVDDDLMARAGNPLFMHPLPAHRGQEVTGQVLDSASSIVYDQAENRLHTQKALLLGLLQH